MRKAVLTVGIFAAMVLFVFGIGFAADPSSGFHQVVESSPCPVTGCASGECHGFENVPEPDGVHELQCPEVSCGSVECHAWDSLIGRYHQASDASLNVWILMPVVLVVGLIIMITLLSRKDTRGAKGRARADAGSRADANDGAGADVAAGANADVEADPDASAVAGADKRGESDE